MPLLVSASRLVNFDITDGRCYIRYADWYSHPRIRELLMVKPFLRVLPPDEARELLRVFCSLDLEDVPMTEAVFRVIGEPVKVMEDMPGFDRSTMDGFAVRSSDTFGASESSPALFQIAGEVAMGEMYDVQPSRGQAVRIWTGGALPPGCDAVVMLEQTEELDEQTIEVLKAVAPYENVVRKGEDFKAGETLLKVGRRLRPQDLGLLASVGRRTIRVYRKPSVAIISSGDEIVPIDQNPPPGCMRDVNRHTLTALAREAYADPVWIGIAPDTFDALSSLVNQGLHVSDLVLISGGSSMGSRDLVIEVLESYKDSQILLHGVSVSPGKPLILARVGDTPVFGLPGHPVSAMVCFEQFVVPLIRRLEGETSLKPFFRPALQAFLSRNLSSREGRTDYIRVRLQQNENGILAVPIPGKSGMVSAMVRADGFVRIAADCEGLYKGDQVTVHLLSNWIGDRIETEHLSGHEVAGRSSGDLSETHRSEQLSRD